MKWKIFILIVLTAVLMYIPYVNTFIKIFNTMFHEGGHAIMTLLTHGKVSTISLFSNVEGVTKSQTSSWLSTFLISLSGYIFASLTAFLFCILWSKHKNKTIILSTLGFSLVSLFLWVRNPFGVLWLIISSAILLFIFFKVKNAKVLSSFALVLTIILLTESIVSSFDILYLSYNTPKEAGDAANLSKLTFLPTLFWGIIFFLQSLVFGFFSAKTLWKTKEKTSFLSK